MLSRKFEWISSIEVKNEMILAQLESEMNRYYRNSSLRGRYNQMIRVTDVLENLDEISKAFLEWVVQFDFKNVLEVGSGTGRIWNHLQSLNLNFKYTGVEVDESTSIACKLKWPEQTWISSSVYDLPFSANSFDLCFSFYVLEHLIFPARGLSKMLEMVKPGGYLVLIFPDFCASGRLPSQHIGFGSERSSLAKLKKFRFSDAAVSFYDSRLRLAPALRKSLSNPGRFLINSNPVCLHYNAAEIWPDIDAVYISNKVEIETWAKRNGCETFYPKGIDSPFDEHTFIVIQKP